MWRCVWRVLCVCGGVGCGGVRVCVGAVRWAWRCASHGGAAGCPAGPASRRPAPPARPGARRTTLRRQAVTQLRAAAHQPGLAPCPPSPPPPGDREDTLVEMSFFVPRENQDFPGEGDGQAAAGEDGEAAPLPDPPAKRFFDIVSQFTDSGGRRCAVVRCGAVAVWWEVCGVVGGVARRGVAWCRREGVAAGGGRGVVRTGWPLRVGHGTHGCAAVGAGCPPACPALRCRAAPRRRRHGRCCGHV